LEEKAMSKQNRLLAWTTLALFMPYIEQEFRKGFAEAEDTYYCTGGCGERRRSRREVRQEERDETCLYVCTACGKVADPLPF
jgi:predicted SprT family Zn-dependent metalloprotease